MKLVRQWVGVAVLCAVLAACSGSKDKSESESAGEDRAAQQVAKPTPAPTAKELPVAEDFEAAAQKQITARNYESKLDALNNAIAADE